MTDTFEAELTQYILPNGRVATVKAILPAEVENKYREMMSDGNRLEAEVLQTGDVSVTIFDSTEQEDIDIAIIPNGPGVKLALIELLRRYESRSVET